MKVTVVPAEQLTPDHVSAWSHLQRGNHALDSPFLTPEYTQLVASARQGVEVAVLKHAGETLGFFPYQRQRRGVAYPVGYPMCDFQAIIAAENTSVDVEDLMHQCRLRAWHFDHLIASQELFGPYHCVTASSPYIDLSGGFEKYQQDHGDSKTIKKAAVAKGMGTLRVDGAGKALRGITSVAEVLRATEEEGTVAQI